MKRHDSISRQLETHESCFPPETDWDGKLNACIAKAESFLQILDEESEILRRFSGQELLNILPQKERLSMELKGCIVAFKEGEKGRESSNAGSARYGFLKQRLREIARKNEANRVFIDGSLLYYRELLDCFRPSGCYAPGGDESAKLRTTSYKGLVFRKEA